MALRKLKNKVIFTFDGEELWIEPWGNNSIRVRSTKLSKVDEENNWALLLPRQTKGEIRVCEEEGVIINGKITASIKKDGKITFTNHKGEVLLEEYKRIRDDVTEYCSSLLVIPREFKPILGGDYSLTVRFESQPSERLYGMGQYQQESLNLKGCTLELAQRNSQASVPFMVSSLGYGFLWNNPAIGEVSLAKNITKWHVGASKQLDYWITAGDTPAEIEEAYAEATGKVPMMPEYAMGFWQCKLRYRTQEELMDIAREYKRRGLPISVIVCDFFHWPNQGTWMFDKNYWPDPKQMIKELKEMEIELMVSIWPTVDSRSSNYEEMLEKGYLVRSERGVRSQMLYLGNCALYDATNPEARNYLWNKVKQNYYDIGIKLFWLDEAEPEYNVYDFDNYRYHLGPNVQIGNIYPFMYAKGFYEGMEKEGQQNIINLIRCAWAGSQRFGALVWSGDIHSSFRSMRCQLQEGLNMGMAGIPWWTTDIGGFHGGNPNDPEFKECFVRWFQYGTFCPVFRLHGYREPILPPLSDELGGGMCDSGSPNEVWSYGEEVYEIAKKYMFMRERLKPYISELMKEAHEKGTPPMRPLFYDFPNDEKAWKIEDEYMFGPNILVAPILEIGIRNRQVYLPKGEKWISTANNECFEGGQMIVCEAPIEHMPLFVREGQLLLLQQIKDVEILI